MAQVRMFGCVFVLFAAACACNGQQVHIVEHNIEAQLGALDRQGRSFRMGFTNFPYDFTSEAQLDTDDHINRFGDIVAFHYDRGIPWDEALSGDHQYHPNLIAEIDSAVASIREGQQVYLALAPQSQQRRGELCKWSFHKDPRILAAPRIGTPTPRC